MTTYSDDSVHGLGNVGGGEGGHENWMQQVAPRTPESERILKRLAAAIEQQVIPRLAASETAERAQRLTPKAVTEQVVAELTDLVVQDSGNAALEKVQALHLDGVPLANLYLDLLAPVARRLGEMWVSDECTFAHVTLGMCKLHQVLHTLTDLFCENAPIPTTERAALILPAPDEQHMFGALVVADFLRRAGWDVNCGPAVPEAELMRMAADRKYTLVGLSVSTDAALAALPRQIEALRSHSLNPAVEVLVGGWKFSENPDLASEVGADGTAADAGAAALQFESRLAKA